MQSHFAQWHRQEDPSLWNSQDTKKFLQWTHRRLSKLTRQKKKQNKNSKKSKPSKPLHFISSDGIDIYVGKNNIQNDYLSLKLASKNHLWLHTKNIPGSHVIICATDIPDSTLEEAAALAAYYSKAQNSTKVPVDYTLVKNLKKPSGAKPGMVIYHTNYTLLTDPKSYTELNIVKE